MPTVVFVFEATSSNLKESFPFNSKNYFPTYAQFASLASKVGIDVRFSFNHLYRGSSTFSGAFSIISGKPTWQTEDITAEYIVIRSLTFPEQLDGTEKTLNKRTIIDAARDKATTYKLFPNYMLPTLELNPSVYRQQLESIPGDMIVCKPRHGHGGSGIYIGPKADFRLPVDSKEGYILQQFLDTSHGIPGITTGIHDLRIILSGFEPLSYVRIPKPGTLLANLSQGGEARALSTAEIPESALHIAREIEAKLSPDFPHFYCADFLFGPDGKPVLCELNSQPGFSYNEGEGPAFVSRYHQTLLKVIQEALATQE
jgi:glutathione synthase/RimK-type ligase-like ATP-grasp enzyme